MGLAQKHLAQGYCFWREWEGGGIIFKDTSLGEPVNFAEFTHDARMGLAQKHLAQEVAHVEVQKVFDCGEDAHIHSDLQLQDGGALYLDLRHCCDHDGLLYRINTKIGKDGGGEGERG